MEDDLLTLEADVFGPFNEASEVSLGADVLACIGISDSVGTKEEREH